MKNYLVPDLFSLEVYSLAASFSYLRVVIAEALTIKLFARRKIKLYFSTWRQRMRKQ